MATFTISSDNSTTATVITASPSTYTLDTTTGPVGPQGATGATGPASAWGTIPGTLSDQTDLQSALDLKATDSLVLHKAGAETVTGSKTFNAGTFLDKGNEVFNVKAYGAVGDGVTDDTTAIQAALTAAASGGTIYLPAGSYIVATPLNLPSNSRLTGAGEGRSIIIGTYTFGNRGAIEIGGSGVRSNVTIDHITFNTTGLNAAVQITRSTNITIDQVSFTGTSANSSGTIYIADGATGTSDVTICNCRIYDMVNCPGVYITSINGADIRNVLVNGCHIENINSYGVHADGGAGVGLIKDIRVVHNSFIDLIGTIGLGGIAVFAGQASAYRVYDLLVDGNTYRNSRVGVEGQGFAWVYSCINVKVINNTAIGPSTYQASQIFIAPGRLSSPIIDLEVGGNYVEGFTAFIDPDSSNRLHMHHNTIVECHGSGNIGTGYGDQKYIDLHDNIIYNSWGSTTGLEAFILLANASTISGKIHDNILIEDTATRHTKYFIVATGAGAGFDHSDIEIYNNKVYIPNNDLEAFMLRQSTNDVFPRRVENNTINQFSGVLKYNQVAGSTVNEVEKAKTYNGASVTLAAFATPTAPTVTVTGTTGATAYGYKVVAVNADGTEGIPSAATSVANGNASLTSSNYNSVSWPVVSGARYYKVLKSVSAGAYQVLTLATSLTAEGTTTGLSILDQGQYTASSYTPAVSNPGGVLTAGSLVSTGVNTLSGATTATAATSSNIVPITINQNDTSNNPRGLIIVNAGTGNALFLDANGNTGTNTTTSGAVLLENTGNTGIGLNIYSDQAAAAAPLITITADNTGFADRAVALFYDGSLYAQDIQVRGGGEGLRINQNTTAPSASRSLLELSSNQNRTNSATSMLNISDTSTSSTKNVIELASSSTGIVGLNIAMTGTTSKGINITHNTSTNREALGVFISSAYTGTTTTAGVRFDMSNASSSGTLVEVTQSGTGATMNLIGNAVTSGNVQSITSNGLTTGINLSLTSSSTAGGASGVSYILKAARSGANANTAHTAYGLYSTVINTNGTSGTNVAGYLSASGATTANYALEIAAGDIKVDGASNLILDTTTGTKIGTATSQKLSVWNATPIIQPTTGVAAATFVTNTSLIANDTATFDGYTIGQVVKALRNIGLLA